MSAYAQLLIFFGLFFPKANKEHRVSDSAQVHSLQKTAEK